MDAISTIIASFIAFNVVLVFGTMYVVRKIKLDQVKRERRVVDLAKENHALKEISSTKDTLLKSYRTLIEKLKL